MPDPDHPEVHWHEHAVSREARAEAYEHHGCVIWFTGLSGSGKSTVANLVDHKLHAVGVHSFVLDGDNIRHDYGLNASPQVLSQRHGDEFGKRFGLGFSAQDREENIRRIGAVAKLAHTVTSDSLSDKETPLTMAPIVYPETTLPVAVEPASKSMATRITRT